MGKKDKLQKDDLLGIAFRESKKETVTYTKRPTLKLDKDGILLYKIPYGKKFDYYPIFMARYSLGNLELYLDTNKEKYKKVFPVRKDGSMRNRLLESFRELDQQSSRRTLFDKKIYPMLDVF